MFQNEVHRLLLPVKYKRYPVAVAGRPSKTAVSRGLRGPGTGIEDFIAVIYPPALGDATFLPPRPMSSSLLQGHTATPKTSRTPPPCAGASPGGFRSLAVNRRGHTPGQPPAALRWNLPGDVGDLE